MVPPAVSVLDLQTVQCRVADGVGVMTLNRPPQLNAWIRRLGDDMLEALDRVRVRPRGPGDRGHRRRPRVLLGGRSQGRSESIRPDGTVDVLTPLRESYNPVADADPDRR